MDSHTLLKEYAYSFHPKGFCLSLGAWHLSGRGDSGDTYLMGRDRDRGLRPDTPACLRTRLFPSHCPAHPLPEIPYNGLITEWSPRAQMSFDRPGLAVALLEKGRPVRNRLFEITTRVQRVGGLEDVRSGTRPGRVVCLPYDPCRHGIAFHVPHGCMEVRLAHRKAVEPPLPQVTPPALPEVDHPCIPLMRLRKALGQGLILPWHRNEMHMGVIRQYAQNSTPARCAPRFSSRRYSC